MHKPKKNDKENNLVEENNDNNPAAAIPTVEKDTLDEDISTTLKRDLLKIFHKLECVLIPKDMGEANKQIRDWDLWGPLLFCILLSVTLGFGGSHNQTGLIFVIVFLVVWFGGLIVTLNAQFLGSNVTLFQSICLLGYCLFPINIASLLIKLLGFLPTIVHIVFSLLGFVWASWSSVRFMGSMVAENKKILATYPVFLFYLFLAWFILTE